DCTFPACPPPNVEFPDSDLAFALPAGYIADESVSKDDPTILASYVKPDANDPTERITIRRFAIPADSTAAAFIQSNAVLDPSGMPASPTAITSTTIGTNPPRIFSTVQIGRFEGVVDVAYYLTRENEVLRFDALDLHVANWTDPSLTVST